MDLDDLSSEMIVLQPLIELKSTSGRTVLKHSGPLSFEEVCLIILFFRRPTNIIPVTDLDHVGLICRPIGWGCQLNPNAQWGVNTPYYDSNPMMTRLSHYLSVTDEKHFIKGNHS